MSQGSARQESKGQQDRGQQESKGQGRQESRGQAQESRGQQSSLQAMRSSSHTMQMPHFEGAMDDLVKHLGQFAKENPTGAALWCFGIGFVLGWRLKPW